jgi:membrane protease YdiL (CAAX protease family)
VNARPDNGRHWFFPFAVLLAGVVLCFLILWGGPQLAGRAISALSGGVPSSAATSETIASIIIFGLILVAGLGGGALCGFNAAGLGPSAGLRLLIGGGIGLVGILIATTLAGIAGLLHRAPGGIGAGIFLGGTALIILQAGSEEVFFRGWLQPILVKAWGVAGILTTAIAFAALHLIGGAISVVSVLNMFLGGLVFGLLAARYGGIAAAVAAHFAWNWAESLLFGLYPNPGNGSFGSILNFDLVGSSWWGGSDEGLNASIGMTFALAILLAPLLIIPARGSQPPEPYRSDRAPA